MKNWNNACRRRAVRDLAAYRKMLQLPPAVRDGRKLRRLMRRRMGRIRIGVRG